MLVASPSYIDNSVRAGAAVLVSSPCALACLLVIPSFLLISGVFTFRVILQQLLRSVLFFSWSRLLSLLKFPGQHRVVLLSSFGVGKWPGSVSFFF